MQPFPYTDQKSTNVNHLLNGSVCVYIYLTHTTAKACSQKKCVFVEGPDFATNAKKIYWNHEGSDVQRDRRGRDGFYSTLINEQCPMAWRKVSFTAE